MRTIRFPLFLFFSFFLLTPLGAQSIKQKQLEEKRQELLEEIKQINTLLFDAIQEEKSVLTQVEDLSSRIITRENLIRVTNQQANLLSREINSNLDKIDNLRGELKELKEDYAMMIIKSYKSKTQQSRIMFLLSSENFLQAYKRFQYMKQYAKHRKKQGESIKGKTLALQELNKGLIAQKKKKQVLISENKVAKSKLINEKKDQEGLIASLKKDEGVFTKQIQRKQDEAEKIDRQIEALIKAAILASNKDSAKKKGAAAKTSSTFALTAEAKALAVDFTNNKGKLPWPLKNGVVVKRFGDTRHPQLPNVTTYCSGVEIATERNAKARAVFNGRVMEIQKIKGANNAIIISHGNYFTVYQNMINVLVKKGDKVTTKQNLGTVYTKSSSGKTILKFLVFKNSTKMNPASWVYKM